MRKRLNIKKILVILAVAIFLLILFKYALHVMSSPAVGTVTLAKTTEKSQVLKDDTNYSSLSNDYYSLLYPSGLTADFPDVKPAGAIAYNFLSIRDNKHDVRNSLEVYIKNLPNGGITLDSDYKNYQSQQKLYKLSSKYMGGELVDVASRNSGTIERGGMWVHGNYVMIIKLKGTDKSDTDTQFTTILKSVQWLKS